MNKDDLDQQLNDVENKYDQALDRIKVYESKVDATQTAFENCRTSASYKLGHLLIHETKTLKDIFKLFSRINTIRKESRSNSVFISESKIKKNSKASNKFKLRTTSSIKETFKDGISIILPTYKGEQTILRALTSLAKQDLSYDLFEIIIVINGGKDDSENIISKFSKENPELNIRTFIINQKGASLARNKGIHELEYKYTVLIDDDDSISPTYLSTMYDLASDDTIVLSQIVDIEENTVNASNFINMQILQANPLKDNLLIKCPSVLTMNACKLVPSSYMKQIEFDPSLNSGEDIVYFCELFSKASFKFKISKEAIYFRFIKYNSVSRQPLSFQFNVQERLSVISNIFKFLNNAHKKDIQLFLQQKISAQISFINTYLREYPNEYERIIEEIKKNQLDSFPYQKLKKKDA